MMINAVLEYLGLKKRPRSASDASERAATRPKTGQTLDEVVMGLVSPSVTVEEAIAAVEEDAITPPAEEVAEEDDDDDEEDGIDPSTLPTVTQSYVLGTLAASASELYPHDSTLNARVVLWRGDITTLRVDAIVNAANKALLGGGGVDGAIHSAAGPGLLAECRFLNGAQTGESKITAGHALPAKHIIHTVGPIYSRNKKVECERLLRACYETTLQLAVNNGCKSLAFSGISTGIYGYPLEDASRVALDTIRTFLSTPAGASLDQVILTVFRSIDVDTYVKITPEYFPPGPAAEEGLEVEKKESEPEFAGEKKDEVTA